MIGIKITDSATNYIVADTLPEGYDEIKSIELLDKHGLNFLQYIQVRGYIFDATIQIVSYNFSTWNNLSGIEKNIVAKWCCAPYQLRLSRLSDEEDFVNYRQLIEQTAGIRKENLFGRSRIVEEMRQFIALNYYRKELINKDDVDDIYSTCKGKIIDYINTNSPTFWYWLNNTVGTPFENAGFKQKSYYTQELVTALNNIQNYNY